MPAPSTRTTPAWRRPASEAGGTRSPPRGRRPGGPVDAQAHAKWSVDQKSQAAPGPALVYDTLYREGRVRRRRQPGGVAAAPGERQGPLLRGGARIRRPPGGRPGQASASPGSRRRSSARVTYLSPQPEYTPPILYNRDNRAKLVFMVEAVFAAGGRGRPPPRPAGRRRARGAMSAGAELAIDVRGVTKRFGGEDGRQRHRPPGASAARSTASSGPTAAARRRSSGCSAACSPPTAARGTCLGYDILTRAGADQARRSAT